MESDDSSDDDVTATLRAWARAEILQWYPEIAGAAETTRKLKDLNESVLAFILLSIADGKAETLAKPIAPAAGGDDVDGGESSRLTFFRLRERTYRSFFGSVAQELCPELSTVVGISLDDAPVGGVDQTPTLAFQKPRGSKILIVPDIELVAERFFTGRHFVDGIPYAEKKNLAFFAGSTSGAFYTMDVVRNCAAPRLDAAMYFRNNAYVEFLLPKLVQCDSEETRSALRSLGFGDGKTFTWTEQFKYKFLISMDGNGATCSRVAIALRSNSVLLKYESNNDLYYFRGLVPWVHYIPIRSHKEVEDVVRAESAHPGLFEPIAQSGREFAEQFLNVAAGKEYTAALLRNYASAFGSVEHLALPPSFGSPYTRSYTLEEALMRNIQILVHVANRGDVLAAPEAWVGGGTAHETIEGLQIMCKGNFGINGLEYLTLPEDQSNIYWVPSPEFSGARGASRPIFGFAARFTPGMPAGEQHLAYQGVFSDGTVIGPVRDGQMCRSEKLLPLVRIRIYVEKV